MNLKSILNRVLPNPDIVGRVMIREQDVPAESREALERKRAAAKDYIDQRGLVIPPAYGTRQ